MQKERCHVCFLYYHETFKTPISDMIQCTKCKKSAHRYCYSPSVSQEFLCDGCKYGNGSKLTCAICGNGGLLKIASPNKFGHPVCFMFSRFSFVKEYKNLSFYYKQSPTRKKIKCFLCNHTDSTPLKCYDSGCKNYAHAYCILSERLKYVDTDSQSWMHLLKISPLNANKFKGNFLRKTKFFLKNQWTVFKEVWNSKKTVFDVPYTLVYCPNHLNVLGCFCTKQIEDEQIKWILCDSCYFWFHYQCQNLSSEEVPEGDYQCSQCQKWHKIIWHEKQPFLEKFPRIHFYDLVYIQNYYERKNFKVSTTALGILLRLPFMPSLKYVFEYMKSHESLNEQVLSKVNIKQLKTHLNKKNIKSLEENVSEVSIKKIVEKIEFLVIETFDEFYQHSEPHKYSYLDVKNILQKFVSMKFKGAESLKDVLCSLEKLQKQERKHEEQMFQSSEQTILELEKKMKILEGDDFYNFQSKLKYVFQAFIEQRNLKSFLRQYVEMGDECWEYIEPLVLFQKPENILNYMKIKYLFQNFKTNKKEKKSNAFKIITLYESSSIEVKKENKEIYQQIKYFYGDNLTHHHPIYDKVYFNNFWREKERKNFYMETSGLFSNTLFSNEIVNERIITWFIEKVSCIQFSRQEIQKVRAFYESSQKDTPLTTFVASYIKLYDQLKAFLKKNNRNTENNLLSVLQKYPIKVEELESITIFFNTVFKLPIQQFSSISAVFREKFQQYCNILRNRPFPFSSDKQLSVVKIGMNKFNLEMKCFSEHIKKDNQLKQILMFVENRKYEDPSLIQNALERLSKSVEYCQKHNLKLRKPLVLQVFIYYKLFQQAINTFPLSTIIKPEYLSNITNKKSKVDFYVLQNYLKSLQFYNFPSEEYLSRRVKQMYEESLRIKQKYIYPFISSYNSLLSIDENFDTHEQPIYRVQKEPFLKVIKNCKGDIVTFQPEIEEIKIICSLYEELLKKGNDEMSRTNVNYSEIANLHTEIMKIPFHLNFIGKQMEKVLIRSNFYKKNNLGFFNKVDVEETRITSYQISSNYERTKEPETILGAKKHSFYIQEILEEMREKGESYKTEKGKRIMEEMKKIVKISEKLFPVFQKVSDSSFRWQKLSKEEIKICRKAAREYDNQFIRSERIERVLEIYRYEKGSEKSSSESSKRSRRKR